MGGLGGQGGVGGVEGAGRAGEVSRATGEAECWTEGRLQRLEAGIHGGLAGAWPSVLQVDHGHVGRGRVGRGEGGGGGGGGGVEHGGVVAARVHGVLHGLQAPVRQPHVVRPRRHAAVLVPVLRVPELVPAVVVLNSVGESVVPLKM